MRTWRQRTTALHDELAAVAAVERWWWLFAGGVALAEPRAREEVYLACDTEPDGDTFMGYPAPAPRDVVADAIGRARAARAAVAALDGTLPAQPLAVCIAPGGTRACGLDVVAFAIGPHCLVARLDDPALPAQLARVIGGAVPPRWHGDVPFVCVALGDEPLATARHGHRRAWANGAGPWLGLSRAGELAIVSTCHLVVDGYGHAQITAAIAGRARDERVIAPATALPTLCEVPGGVPLSVAWCALDGAPLRVIPLAYELGRILHRDAGPPDAAFSPTIQIPVARGDQHDPLRLRRRVVSAITSVRFMDGAPEPFATFEARVRDVLVREAAATGLASRLLAAARAVPVPLAWKRKGIGAKRPPWLDRIASLVGGRALVSRISLPDAVPLTCAVSSPSRLASAADPTGGCVVTIVDDGVRGAITLSGSGSVARPEVLGELLTRLRGTGAAHAPAVS